MVAAVQTFQSPGGESNFDNPASYAAAVTPDDNTDLTNTARSLYIGTTGNLKVTTRGGNPVIFTAVAVGILPVMVSRVWSTGTTALNIIALW